MNRSSCYDVKDHPLNGHHRCPSTSITYRFLPRRTNINTYVSHGVQNKVGCYYRARQVLHDPQASAMPTSGFDR